MPKPEVTNPLLQHFNPFRRLKRYLIYKYKHKTNIDGLAKNFDNLDIDKIFKYFNTDKATTWNGGKDTGHGYSRFYEKYLKIFKNRKINILEIGSFSGASAASFAKYFPLSTIYCLDINLTNFKFISKNIKVFGLDVSQKLLINKFYQKINISHETKYFDIIVDDGSHKLSDIIISLNIFFKNLRSGGFYIVEDFKFPNYYSHLNDCPEKKIDEMLICLKNKKKFASNIISLEMIQYLLNFIEDIFEHRGLSEDSDIAFIKRLN